METSKAIEGIIHSLTFTGRIFALLTIISFPFAMQGLVAWNDIFYMSVITGIIVTLVSIIGVGNTVFLLVKKLIQALTKKQAVSIMPLPGDMETNASMESIMLGNPSENMETSKLGDSKQECSAGYTTIMASVT